MRSLFIQIAAVATAGVLAVLFLLFTPSFRRDTVYGAPEIPFHESPKPDSPSSARVLNNPYTEWFFVWQNQNLSNTIVIAAMQAQDVSWLQEELADLPDLRTAVYLTDDTTAPLHTPANKGNEAMVYLSYIIDFYDDLPDVSTFMHYHRGAWHISELLERSSSESIRRLSREKVVRDGYVNLRCDLAPGCPVSAQLDRLGEEDSISRMSAIVADSLRQMFPNEPLPSTLAQPCCAQFAVSRKLLQRRPKEYYTALRDWLIASDFPETVSGRVFEYLWHYIFLSQPVFCPNEHLCWCDTYSVCFETEEAWEQYNALINVRHTLEREEGDIPFEENSPRRGELRLLIDGLYAEEKTRKEEAFTLGSNLASRQKILSDSWEVLKSRGRL